MNIKTEISKIHYDKQAKGFFFNLLRFCSIFYGIGSGLKNKFYEKGICKPKKVDAFVISIGNLTTGGVGKTPVVAQLANYLTDKGEKVAIVSRGYGGKLKGVNVISDGNKVYFEADLAGDEPNWLAKNTKAVVITAKDRYKGAKYAVEKLGATKIILDDGFQHRKLHRDLDVVLVDSEKCFGNENLLPAGPLREGLEAFSRIDKLVVVSKNIDHTRAEKYAKVMGKKLKINTTVCYTEPDFTYNIANKEELLLLGEKVVAFSAIGQPEQFYQFLKDYDVASTTDFDDHHTYTQKDIDDLNKLCLNCGAKYLVTTEKDAVKCLNLKSDIKIFALKLKTQLDWNKLFDEK